MPSPQYINLSKSNFTVAAIAILVVLNPARAQISEDWFDDSCAEKSQARWCTSTLVKRGWTLKYLSENSKDVTEVFWRLEVWTKGPNAYICELKGSAKGLRSNGCYNALEVPPTKS